MRKIDKNLRNLVMKQAETLMLSRTHCVYMGETYHFDEVTPDEIEEQCMKLLGIINKKSWAKIVLEKLRLLPAIID